MADITRVLREEIARLARKEIRTETERLRRASSQYRTDIAALKRQIAGLEKQLGRVARATKSSDSSGSASTEDAARRFSVKGLKSLRARLELSATDLGKLLGVTPQTVYNWEAEKTRPRADQIAAIASFRSIGKRQVRTRLGAAVPE